GRLEHDADVGQRTHDRIPGNANCSASGGQKSGGNFEQCAFTATASPHHCNELPWLHAKGDFFEGGNLIATRIVNFANPLVFDEVSQNQSSTSRGRSEERRVGKECRGWCGC